MTRDDWGDEGMNPLTRRLTRRIRRRAYQEGFDAGWQAREDSPTGMRGIIGSIKDGHLRDAHQRLSERATQAEKAEAWDRLMRSRAPYRTAAPDAWASLARTVEARERSES